MLLTDIKIEDDQDLKRVTSTISFSILYLNHIPKKRAKNSQTFSISISLSLFLSLSSPNYSFLILLLIRLLLTGLLLTRFLLIELLLPGFLLPRLLLTRIKKPAAYYGYRHFTAHCSSRYRFNFGERSSVPQRDVRQCKLVLLQYRWQQLPDHPPSSSE